MKLTICLFVLISGCQLNRVKSREPASPTLAESPSFNSSSPNPTASIEQLQHDASLGRFKSEWVLVLLNFLLLVVIATQAWIYGKQLRVMREQEGVLEKQSVTLEKQVQAMEAQLAAIREQ